MARSAAVPRAKRDPMPDPGEMMIAAWRTTSRVTSYLVERLPAALWDAEVPGAPRRTVRGIAAHLHATRRTWIAILGREHGVEIPVPVDRRTVGRRELLAALRRSSRGIESLLELGLASGGRVPPSRGYVWRNLPLDVGHVLAYFVAHEGHHRGQLVMIARQLGHRLPPEVAGGLWQWQKRSREARHRAQGSS